MDYSKQILAECVCELCAGNKNAEVLGLFFKCISILSMKSAQSIWIAHGSFKSMRSFGMRTHFNGGKTSFTGAVFDDSHIGMSVVASLILENFFG